MKFKLFAVFVGVVGALAGCGGGSSAESQATAVILPVTVTPPVAVTPPPVVTPIAVKSTSYANAKDMGWSPVTVPNDTAGTRTYAQADFRQNGTVMLFTATLTYDLKKPVEQATPSVFAFYSKNASGNWVKEAGMIDTPNGCIHPRKAVVADFNGDGKPDVLVACHGYDAPPFTGEQNFLVLSTPSGVYTSKAIPSTPGFFHSVTAADFNGDGKIDFIVTDTNASGMARMFLGNGNGTFTENTVLPAELSKNRLYTVEATDVDGDGKIDLLFGADENIGGSHSLVVLGDGTGNFVGSKVVALPTDLANGTTLDFVVKNGVIYELRTASDAANFYNTTAIDKVDFAKLTITNVFQSKGQGWATWLIPTATGVTSDNTANPASANF